MDETNIIQEKNTCMNVKNIVVQGLEYMTSCLTYKGFHISKVDPYIHKRARDPIFPSMHMEEPFLTMEPLDVHMERCTSLFMQ